MSHCLSKHVEKVTYKRDPLRAPPPQMKHGELRHRGQPIPSDSMQLRQYTRSIPRRELDGLEFAAAVGPHTQIKLNGVVVAADYGRGGLEIAGHVVGIGDGKRRGV